MNCEEQRFILYNIAEIRGSLRRKNAEKFLRYSALNSADFRVFIEMNQQQALDILKTGRNVFLTGEPGSGKTHTVNAYVDYLKQHGIEPAVTASTGIAATHIGGMTIHSWSGIGIKKELSKYDLHKIAAGYASKRIKRAKVLIIDEVSMLAPETFLVVDQVCREVKESSEPFGGIQVVLVGDFFQLPPIVKSEPSDSSQLKLDDRPSARFVYQTAIFQKANVVTCYLTDQYRQDDKDFLEVLSAIRHNTFNGTHLNRLQSRMVDGQSLPASAPKLFSYNADVDRINHQILDSIEEEPRVFDMAWQGITPLVDILKKGCLSPQQLSLKKGASVMFTKNNLKEGYVNGTLGTVEGFDADTLQPVVKTRSGGRVMVSPADWTIEERGKVRAKISQFPLRLAWAITVHKSQGMSLDEAAMDLSGVFEFGQGYVALSRVRRLNGLYLLGFNGHAFKVHPEVLKKDAEFLQMSKNASLNFDGLAKSEIEKAKNQFILSCGGRTVLQGKKPFVNSLKNIEEKFGFQKTPTPEVLRNFGVGVNSAYKPWNKNSDDELRRLFEEGFSIGELAVAFHRTRGAIKARLAKLDIEID